MKRNGTDGLRWSILLLCFVLVSSMMGMPEQKKAKAVKSDVQYIRCGVCEELARNIHRSVKSMREELRPGKKLPESQILDMLENVCNPEKEQGEWITMIDLVESGSQLKLERQDWPGKCGTECRTIARACEEIIGDRDTDLAEFLYNDGLQRTRLNNWLCYEETDACNRKTPPLPKDRAPGPAFEEMTEQDLKMQKMMRDLGNVPGMPGMQMFSRDELQQQMDEMEDVEDENADLGLDGDYDMDEDAMMDDEPPPSLGETVTRGAKAIKDGVMSSFQKGKQWASQKLKRETEL